MLYALSIRSFVLIDQLNLEAPNGFTALTGETGAGKSIILDALALVLGGAADRTQIRDGDDQASVTAEFCIASSHPAWDVLDAHGLSGDRSEAIVLRRTLSRAGPSRGFINGQSVAASVLSRLGESLVEIHGQHAASRLMRPSEHLLLLDAFGGLEHMAASCGELWRAYELKRAERQDLEAQVQAARETREWLSFAVEELSALAPEPGEVETLSAQRSALLQSERVTESIDEASDALSDSRLQDSLIIASKAAERVIRTPGIEALETDLGALAETAASAIESALIELDEAQQSVQALKQFGGHDADQLERVETRLFTLRAAARKFDCLPEHLADKHASFEAKLALCDSDTQALERAQESERLAYDAWQSTAQKLSQKRRAKAQDIERAVKLELAPLHLGRVSVRVRFADLADGESGAKGLERAEFGVETNPGAGFGPLKSIASGGELARFSLALKCALSQTGDAATLIFDEADQGVGGAVAAAIGERLAALSATKQVFAITHSPQVASAAHRQWRVMKDQDQDGRTISHVAPLDDGQRLEEIARMLSGSSITNEARAAALKLLEAA